jgi:hypothetical protein
MKELKTDEEETGLRFNDPPFVNRLLWPKHREIDPGESASRELLLRNL